MDNPANSQDAVLCNPLPWNVNANTIWLASSLTLLRNLEKFNFPGKLSTDKRKQLVTLISRDLLEMEALKNPKLIKAGPDCYLQGFFQSWRHFHKYRDKLLETFAPSENDYHYLLMKYGSLIDHPNTVAVHVRTQSSIAHQAFPFLGLEYYKKGMDIFPEDTQFVIFSDRMDWCKIHFKDFIDKKIVFIDGNDHFQDLYLMSMLKHHIIANSTFSWWGSYLCQNPNKITIAPTPWAHPNFSQYVPKKEDLYLPSWRLIEYDYTLPYPSDMMLYFSESIDNN